MHWPTTLLASELISDNLRRREFFEAIGLKSAGGAHYDFLDFYSTQLREQTGLGGPDAEHQVIDKRHTHPCSRPPTGTLLSLFNTHSYQ